MGSWTNQINQVKFNHMQPCQVNAVAWPLLETQSNLVLNCTATSRVLKQIVTPKHRWMAKMQKSFRNLNNAEKTHGVPCQGKQMVTNKINRPFLTCLLFLFSQYRSCNYTLESIFLSKLDIFMLAPILFNEHNKGSNLLGIVTWSVQGKQNWQIMSLNTLIDLSPFSQGWMGKPFSNLFCSSANVLNIPQRESGWSWHLPHQ